MSAPGVTATTSVPSSNRRQKRMGPAPFASFEDLSDELDSPDEKKTENVIRLPGIREDATPVTPAPDLAYSGGISLIGASAAAASTVPAPKSPPASLPTNKLSLQTPSTPRIDISRASSSSHHEEDSRDSSPERELFEGQDPSSAKLGLGFREEGTLDLRSSTEELDFQDPQSKTKCRTRPQSPSCQEDSALGHNRKDSQSSDIVLLSISGRTSRLSSIGSQGSAQSRISNASHLSVMSGQSGASRSPSPHKMLLETSFCGTKPPKGEKTSTDESGTKNEPEDLEKVLLSRKHDPTEAILAEGISLDRTPSEKPAKKVTKNIQQVKSDITITVDKPPPNESNNVPALPRTYVAPSGVEYTYIPLKGPLPPSSTTTTTTVTRSRTRDVKSATVQSRTTSAAKGKSNLAGKPKAKSATPSPVSHKREDEPKYIRIKLKPDYMYDDGESTSTSGSTEIQKPYTLNLNDASKKPPQSFAEIMQKETDRIEQMNYARASETVSQGKSLSNTPSASPKPSRHTFLKEFGSKTPSPSLSRKSSFCSLFKSRETIISPESPTVPGSKRKSTLTGILREASDNIRERSRSRSKSRERDKSATMSVAPSSTESIDSKSSKKSVFSIFKPKKGEKGKAESDHSSSQEILPNIGGLANVEFKFNSDSNSSKGHRSRPVKRYNETPLEGESIRIPLHSPTHSESRSTLQDQKTSSQDSQDTVIEVTSRNVDAIIEPAPNNIESNTPVKPEKTYRQSSTSSENVVFSTKLGSTNEIFTTKLPKTKTQKVNLEEEEAKSTPKEKCPSCKGTQENVPRLVMEISQMEITNGVAKEIHVKATSTQINLSKDGEVQEVAVEKTEAAITVDREKEKRKRNSVVSSIPDDEHNSSESERDSEFEFLRKKDLTLKLDEEAVDAVEPERKGLVLQQDSFEYELPYIPTTLPLERSVAVPIVPIKQRSTFEMKTYPIERPRSTTPINPSCLEEYCEEVVGNVNVENITKQIEKLKIILPRDDPAQRHSKMTSPRKTPPNPNWTAFAEKGISTQRRPSQDDTKPRRPSQEETTPPPLPPKGIQKEWINFEEIPERRKPPKRIQTIPSRGNMDVPDSVLQENVVYSYVNPEDCKCECHEINAREREKKQQMTQEEPTTVQEDELPLLEEEDEKSTASDRMKAETKDRVSESSVDISIGEDRTNNSGKPHPLHTPFTSDLGMISNRSSFVSQTDPHSSDSESPNNAFTNHLNLVE